MNINPNNKILIVRKDELGSRHKYTRLFQSIYGDRVHIITDKQIVKTPLNVKDWQFAVVFGDKSKAWQHVHRAGIPYVLCQNDVASMRGAVNRDVVSNEEGMVGNARGIIYTSDWHRRYTQKTYSLSIPYEIIYLRPFKDDLPADTANSTKPHGKHLVYAGGLHKWSKRTKLHGYRCYHNIFKAFIARGWTVHVYDVNDGVAFNEYSRLGCITHPTLSDGTKLYTELGKYTAGFHGYNKDGVPQKAFDYTQKCMPNKTWLYLAAGIPTIGFQSGVSGGEFNGRWGVVLDSLSDILGVENRINGFPLNDYRNTEIIDNDMLKLKLFIDRIFNEN